MNLPLIDIGANLTNKRFNNDLDEVVDRAKSASVAHIIVTGTSLVVSAHALELSQTYPGYLSATAGVHPHDAKSWGNKCSDTLHALLVRPTVVAVGECGLDYNRNFSTKKDQLICFEEQLIIATETHLPVFLHERDAHDDFFRLLRKYRDKLSAAVVHCFTGDVNEAKAYIDLDCHIGITGWLSDDRRAMALREAVAIIPLDKLMIETDAPFLMPKGIPGTSTSRRCEPCHLPWVLTSLSEHTTIPELELAERLYNNTINFFGLTG